MQLPYYLNEKINGLYKELNKKALESTREELTKRYKEQTGKSQSLISSKQDSIVYALSRMPATFSVICTLLGQLKEQGLLEGINSVIDIGSGTGAAYFAINELDSSIDVTCVERDKNMIDVFKVLSDGKDVVNADFTKDLIDKKADMVMSSYVISEMTELDRQNSVLKMLEMSDNYVLLIDTGTPRTYENFMRLKSHITSLGYNVIAPCMHEKCGLINDYCQFYARVERTSLLKMAKAGSLSYEDEKYFYLLISQKDCNFTAKRVIRRPIIKENNIELALCTNNGVDKVNFTKKNKEEFKRVKKIKINDILD